MKGIHSSYVSLLDTDLVAEQLVSNTRILPAHLPLVERVQETNPIRGKATRRLGINILLLFIPFVFVIYGPDFLSKASSLLSRVHVVVAPEIQASTQTLSTTQSDIEIVKKILTGLVPAVEEIRKELDAQKEAIKVMPTDLGATLPYNRTVKVITEKAYIREKPTKDSKSLMTLAKDTVLFADLRSGDWLEVNLPIGGKGYIHQSIVELDVNIDSQPKASEESLSEKPKASA